MGSLGVFWRSRSLRERITVAATSLFALAVATGAVLLVLLLQWSLLRASDASALKAANEIATLVNAGKLPDPLLAGGAAADYIQIVDANNRVESAQQNTDAGVSLLRDPQQLQEIRHGQRLTVDGRSHNLNDQIRVIGVAAGQDTVLVGTSLSRVHQSVHILRNAALVGSPIGVLVMALVTYWIVGQTLRPVASLRVGADEITAAGLADQRLPLPNAQDEIQRLAVTLNAMLDRLDAATSRQRTFVGDAAHELRSPIASARLQLEVAQLLGPSTDWNEVVADVMVDIDRLQRLVDDLLVLARSDEADGALRRREPVLLPELVAGLLSKYETSRVPVRMQPQDNLPLTDDELTVSGDPDALRRVAVNLIDNAVRYAGSEVVLTVRARHDERDWVELIVSDDGPGIAPDERSRVFDRFYRVAESRSRQSGGTGLGLPIVQDLVAAHGGQIMLEDNHALHGNHARHGSDTSWRGLTVTVTLPARNV